MENDTLVAEMRDSTTVMPSSDDGVLVNDEIQMPSAEQLGISVVSGNVDASGARLPISISVGDTFDFPVVVSWSVNGSSLLVVPMGAATSKGLMQIGVSQESARQVKDGKEVASITFMYKIVAQDTGNLNIPAMRFEIPTPMGQSLDLRSENFPVRVDAPVNHMPILVGVVVAVCVLLAGFLRMKRRARVRLAEAAQNAAANQLREKMGVLKQRINSADGRIWLLDLESVCKEYAAERFHLDAEKVNLDVLLKQGDLEGWDVLLEKFADARYGGGKRDSFENRETWKAAMKLMGVSDE